ncbi:hypothetical protein ACFLZZ_04565 [Nanoarchaeota archaeon]
MSFSIFNPKKAKSVKVCPKCQSLNIKIQHKSGWWIGLPATYRCMSCNFKSKLFPVIDMEEVKKRYEKKKVKNGKTRSK